MVLYRKLVVAFAFVVPDVKISENYVSFIFTRPNWRNCGIAKYMLYHLIQVPTHCFCRINIGDFFFVDKYGKRFDNSRFSKQSSLVFVSKIRF